MTLPRLSAFAKQWEHIPPLAESVAALAFGFGVLKPHKEGPKEDTPEHKAALADFLGHVKVQRRQRPA